MIPKTTIDSGSFYRRIIRQLRYLLKRRLRLDHAYSVVCCRGPCRNNLASCEVSLLRGQKGLILRQLWLLLVLSCQSLGRHASYEVVSLLLGVLLRMDCTLLLCVKAVQITHLVVLARDAKTACYGSGGFYF